MKKLYNSVKLKLIESQCCGRLSLYWSNRLNAVQWGISKDRDQSINIEGVFGLASTVHYKTSALPEQTTFGQGFDDSVTILTLC